MHKRKCLTTAFVFFQQGGNKIHKFTLNYISHAQPTNDGRAMFCGALRNKKRKL